MAYYLDIGMLLKQTGLIDFLIVNISQHNIFHAVIDGLFKLLYLLHSALWSLRSNVESSLDAIRSHRLLQVCLVCDPTGKIGTVGKQYSHLVLIINTGIVTVAARCQPCQHCSTHHDGGKQPKKSFHHVLYLL